MLNWFKKDNKFKQEIDEMKQTFKPMINRTNEPTIDYIGGESLLNYLMCSGTFDVSNTNTRTGFIDQERTNYEYY